MFTVKVVAYSGAHEKTEVFRCESYTHYPHDGGDRHPSGIYLECQGVHGYAGGERVLSLHADCHETDDYNVAYVTNDFGADVEEIRPVKT